ncbi:MAG TPA: hypothetical protein P5155_00210 [Candidatus Absconditabacterales bacterium]|nr:hypothetical protein [Candidatus Absconditabacterales bacterium]HRU49906.1 hypothetical protein [Candidatus Absconditabacterales bacterium]
MKKSEKTLKNTIKNCDNFVKKNFEKINKYLGVSGWIIVILVIFIIILVTHYQNKIANIESRGIIYYQNPYRIDRTVNVFDEFDRYFDRQNKYFKDLFREQEESMRRYWKFFDSDKARMMNISDKSQQTYQKYYLQDGKIYSYEINYDNGVVNGNIMLDDVDKRNVLIKKLQKLGLELSNSDSNIMFSGELDNINSLLSILD